MSCGRTKSKNLRQVLNRFFIPQIYLTFVMPFFKVLCKCKYSHHNLGVYFEVQLRSRHSDWLPAGRARNCSSSFDKVKNYLQFVYPMDTGGPFPGYIPEVYGGAEKNSINSLFSSRDVLWCLHSSITKMCCKWCVLDWIVGRSGFSIVLGVGDGTFISWYKLKW
jgi:hypothetical protein